MKKELQLSYSLENIEIGRLALILAMSVSREQEDQIKNALENGNYRFCITEVGGEWSDFNRKLYKAVIGATLNNDVISKTSNEMHALLHAVEDAKKGFLFSDVASLHVAVKICVVREKHWIAVGIYGHSAMHSVTNHSRAGLGIMHI